MPRSKNEGRRLFGLEEEARTFVLERLGRHFEFWERVKAVGPDGDRFEFDAVSRCNEAGHVIGWEFKRSHLFKSEFASALRQAVHYRLGRMTDARLPELAGQQLPAMVVFPDWDGRHDDYVSDYSLEASGMRVLADQFRVGVVRIAREGRLSLVLGESAIWHSDSGWNGNAHGKLYGKRSLGALRRHDRLETSLAELK